VQGVLSLDLQAVSEAKSAEQVRAAATTAAGLHDPSNIQSLPAVAEAADDVEAVDAGEAVDDAEAVDAGAT
jgi:hypothetical protein